MGHEQPDTRTRIQEAATALFRRNGYPGTGLKRIAAEANAPFGSIYHFFPGGKQQLAEATVRTAGAEYGRMVLALLESVADPIESVERAFEAAAEDLVASDYADACPIATVALEVASTDEVLRVATADVFAGWVDAGRPVVRSLGARPGRGALTRPVAGHAPGRGVRPLPCRPRPGTAAGGGRSMSALLRAAVERAAGTDPPGGHRPRRVRRRLPRAAARRAGLRDARPRRLRLRERRVPDRPPPARERSVREHPVRKRSGCGAPATGRGLKPLKPSETMVFTPLGGM
ncbi:TetR/AcrR family transcriptional regulator [Streptomyces somaliensis]|nr:TetR/AcrR family transcriptional regulator [Streptomyces somaliensis]